MNKLHPGVRWLFRIRAYYPLIIIGLMLSIWSFKLILDFTKDSLTMSILLVILIFLIFIIIFSEIYARLSYNRYLYDITQDAVKIEKGIIWKKYTSIPYERIQNIDIKRGILARMFGFSTLDIETAGQSGFGFHSIRYGSIYRRRYESEGHLPGISLVKAEKIREYVMKKVKQSHGSGL